MAIDDETLRLARALRITVGTEVDQRVRTLVQAWARAWRESYIAWVEAVAELTATMDAGQALDPWAIARSQRAQAALLAATDEIRELSMLAGVTVTDGVGRIVDVTAEFEAQMTLSQLPDVPEVRTSIGARFNRMDALAQDVIVRRTTERIESLLRPLPATVGEEMRRALVRGASMGDNPRTVAREMLRRVEGAFNGGLTRALVIARTEMLDAQREAARGQRVGNAHLVTGWVWVSALDTRTCPSCWAMHGTEHDIAEHGPDDHQQGRCSAIPLLRSWRELGIDLDEPASVLPDAQARFAELTRADQLKVMGPERLAALDDGRAAWHDLATRRINPGWRDSWVPTPVRDLPGAAA